MPAIKMSDVRKLGSRAGLIAAGIGLLVAELIMVLFLSRDKGFIGSLVWFMDVDYKSNLAVGAAIMLLSGHFYGRAAAHQIVIKHRNALLAGCLCGLAVLVTSAFLSGWLGFFQEGIYNLGTTDDAFEDYIFKPFFWVSVFGAVPALLAGGWLGWYIKRHVAAMPDVTYP